MFDFTGTYLKSHPTSSALSPEGQCAVLCCACAVLCCDPHTAAAHAAWQQARRKFGTFVEVAGYSCS